MSALHCQLLPHSNSRHLQQLYTGFFLLHQSGRIKLTQHICNEPNAATRLARPVARSVDTARHAHLQVIVNNSLRLHYDTHDSADIDAEYLRQTDFYFKRSYAPQQLQRQHIGQQRYKIHPLGFNYAVYPNSFDTFGLRRSLHLKSGEKTYKPLLRALPLFSHLVFTPRVQQMEAALRPRSEPKILFMARAWEPEDNLDNRTGWAEKITQLNENRAACIRLLKKEYGSHFYGGFMHTPFATAHYKNLLLPDKNLASKKHYLQMVQSYPIGVATTGLHNSIGWKFAEYVAFAKAILSEPLHAEVPGPFEQGRHYLAFRSPTELLEQAATLCSDHALRRAMMANNASYYQTYLRPDCLVLNTLLKASCQAD